MATQRQSGPKKSGRTAAETAQVGTNLELIKVLFSRPEWGMLFLIVLVAESALFYMLARVDAGTERLVAMGIFVVLQLAALFAFLRVQKPPQTMPESLTAEPIAAQEAERRDDLIYAPDATFAFGRPPPNWDFHVTTVAEDVGRALKTQLLGDGAPVPAQAFATLQPGTLVVFAERHEHQLEYKPGASRVNGRLALGLVTETVRDQIRIFSVSKRGSLVREVTAEHAFAISLLDLMMGRIVEITQASTGVGGRSTLMARAELKFEEVILDGAPASAAVVEMRLYVVERRDFIYVFRAAHLRTNGADARAKEIEAIINSFQPVSPADADLRARKEEAIADQAWKQIMAEIAPGVLAGKAFTLLSEIQTSPGSVDVSARQAADLQSLVAYARVFREFVPDELVSDMEGYDEAVKQARAGSPAALLERLAALKQQPTPPAPAALEPPSH